MAPPPATERTAGRPGRAAETCVTELPGICGIGVALSGLQHLSFMVASRAIVREAFEWARAHNAEIVHEPRDFPEYGQHYAAFWLDPHGFMLEAVCHGSEEPGEPSSGLP